MTRTGRKKKKEKEMRKKGDSYGGGMLVAVVTTTSNDLKRLRWARSLEPGLWIPNVKAKMGDVYY
jgi:hypothetical protein